MSSSHTEQSIAKSEKIVRPTFQTAEWIFCQPVGTAYTTILGSEEF